MDRIAHIVLDLPIEGHFDYAIPPALVPQARVGARARVRFGQKLMTGFIIGLADQAAVSQVKPIRKVFDPVLIDERDLTFARQFSVYYGCTLGEALAVMTRHRLVQTHIAARKERGPKGTVPFLGTPPAIHVIHCPDGNYVPHMQEVIGEREDVHILVPDAYVANNLGLPKEWRPRVGLRSSMFEAFGRSGLMIVVDDDNASYKQEQSPMYDTRDVVLMAQRIYGFDICFIGAAPTPEVMHLAASKRAVYRWVPRPNAKKPVVIDLTNYKFLEKGILSPPVRNTIQENINAKRRTILVLNRRGSFSVTRCTACGHILKCPHCDASMTYMRSHKQFVCRHCAVHMAEAGPCPACRKLDWRSFGMGVEQLQKELALLFPGAVVAYYEKESQDLPKAFDVLIATQAVLRFKGKLSVSTVIMVDIDGELNRVDMRSSFKGWARAAHTRQMGEQMMVQTHNLDHHVPTSLKADDAALFYAEELRLREELDFAPFYHWIAVAVRARMEKAAEAYAQEIHDVLKLNAQADVRVVPAVPDTPSKLRDKYRFKVMVGSRDVPLAVRFIKNTLSAMKRPSKIIVTLNVDP